MTTNAIGSAPARYSCDFGGEDSGVNDAVAVQACGGMVRCGDVMCVKRVPQAW